MENIITVFVIDRDGVKHKLEAPTDMNMNMMELCRSYELPVKGTCGGMAMCASCQMYVLNDKVTLERSDDEQLMLDEAWYVEENSRLGCQIHLSNDMDGLTVELAPEVEDNNDDDW